MTRIKDGRIQDGCHHQVESEWISLTQTQSWMRVFLSKSESRKTRCLSPTWQCSRWVPSSSWVRMNEWMLSESNIAEFKMTSIIKLSQNEWVKFFFCANGGEGSVSEVFFVQMVGTNLGKCEWVWEEKLRWLNPRWPNSRWQNSRWLPSSSWVRMNKFESDWINLSQSFVQNGWIEDGRIQDGRNSRWLPSSSWVRMNEFEGFFVQNGGNQSWQVGVKFERKITKMAESQDGRVWIQDGRIQDGCHHQVEWEWMTLSQIKLVWVKSQSGVRVFWSESERRKQGVWIQDGNVWIQHGRIQDGCHHQVESE